MILRFNIPDDKFNFMITAICDTYGYQDTFPDGTSNPQTPVQFARQQIVNLMLQPVRQYTNKLRALEAASLAEVDSQINITIT